MKIDHQLHIYTGDGKGKTSCAIGLAVRALGAGLSVDWIAFDKGFDDEEHYSERKILRSFDHFQFFPTGLERVRPNSKFRFGVTPEDRQEALRGLSLAHEKLTKGSADLLVLDEIISACKYHLLLEKEVMELVENFKENRPRELVLTGRGATPGMIQAADLVTEMLPQKHYFDKGVEARRGIDF